MHELRGMIQFAMSLVQEQPKHVAELLTGIFFLPLHIETNLSTRVVTMHGCSPQFAVVNEGEDPPLYTFDGDQNLVEVAAVSLGGPYDGS